jgi:hypothetical protein
MGRQPCFELRAPAAAGALFLLLDAPGINVGNIRKSTSIFKKYIKDTKNLRKSIYISAVK